MKSMKKRLIRPGIPAYLPLGIIFGLIVGLLVILWMLRGAQTKAPEALFFTSFLYFFWCFFVSQRRVEINSEQIVMHSLSGRSRIFWTDVDRSELSMWIDNKTPFQLIIYRVGNGAPYMAIPLTLYNLQDAQYLILDVQVFKR
jgi:hypothetical protein